MAKAATIGLVFNRRGQLYECTAIRPHQRGDGGITKLAVWHTHCSDCGKPFET